MTERPEAERVSLADAYALKTPADSRELYARWAASYESDFVSGNGYVIPARVAEVFAAAAGHLGRAAADDADRLVLDVGCGTGLVALALIRDSPAERRDWVVDGIDISPEMLAESSEKRRPDGSPLYRRLLEADLTGRLDIDDGTYAGVISAGTFTHGHLGPDALCGLIRLGRPGAHFAIGINAEHYVALDFAERLEAEVAARRLSELATHVVDVYLPGSKHHGATAVVATFRRAG